MPAIRRVVMGVQEVLDADSIETGLGLGRTNADWNAATVVVKLPIHGTATTTVQKVEVPLSVLAGLILNAVKRYDLVPLGEEGFRAGRAEGEDRDTENEG